MKALALVAVLVLSLAASVKANTSIIQFARPLCSDSTSREVAAAETLSKEWPVLTPSTQPSLFTVWPPADPASAEYWLALRFDDDQETHAAGPLDRLTRSLRSLASTRYAVRASHPANHPLDLGLGVYNAGEMLRAGGVAVEADDSSTPSSAHGEPGPCRVAYLHIKASRGKAVSIPPRSTSPSSWLLSLVERYYLGPLATGQHSKEPTPTPIHLTLDPLVFGVAPWSLTLGSPLFVPLLLVIVFVVGPAFARVLEKRIQDIVGAHAKTD